MLTQAFTAVLLAGAAMAQTFSVQSPPSIQQCQPASFSWVGGTSPFILSAIPEGQTSAPALVTIAEGVTGSSYTWNVNLAQGTAINLRITDATGAIAYSQPYTVQSGSSGCLSGASASVSSAVTSAVPASSGASSGTSAPANSQTSINASSLSSAAASRSSAAAASSGSASSGAASGMSMTGSGTSRPATSGTSGAANTSNAAGAKAAFNVPVLALAGAGAFVFLGGFAALA